MKTGIILIAVSLIVALAYFFRNQEDRTLTSESRSKINSDDKKQFLKLKDGVVHYELIQASGPVVVLTHGVSGPMMVWDKTFAALKAAGFSVLRYDLYGRGLSDRPDTTYNHDLYVRELASLLEALNIEGPVDFPGTNDPAFLSHRNPKPKREVRYLTGSHFSSPKRKTFG